MICIWNDTEANYSGLDVFVIFCAHVLKRIILWGCIFGSEIRSTPYSCGGTGFDDQHSMEAHNVCDSSPKVSMPFSGTHKDSKHSVHKHKYKRNRIYIKHK